MNTDDIQLAQIAQLRAELARLESENEEIRRATAARAQFVNNISHEFRTPMNSILGMTRLVLATDLTHEQREHLELVWSAGDSLLTLINDLLDHAKLEVGKLRVESIPFRVDHVVGETVRSFKTQAGAKSLDLKVVFGRGLPERVVGDPARLRQVLVNLVGNAIKFTPDGWIEVHVAHDGKMLTCTVRDTGIGMAETEVDRVFKPFEQADASTTRKYGGTGLGLSISTMLVDLMGGQIWAESSPGLGSTFRFTIAAPRHVIDDAAMDSSGRPWGRVVAVTHGSVYRSLVEDAAATVGNRALVFDTVDDAVAKVGGVDDGSLLVILAVAEGSTEAATRVREAAPTCSIVIVTPAGQRGDAAACRDLGVGAYLTGSTMPSDLTAAIDGLQPEMLITRHWLKERRRVCRILVVDDSETNRMLADRILSERGHFVTQATNGVEAVAAVSDADFDVVLMDVQMPELDGYGAVAAIRELPGRRAATRVVALTGSVSDADHAVGSKAGMDGLLVKPYDVEALIECVETDDEC